MTLITCTFTSGRAQNSSIGRDRERERPLAVEFCKTSKNWNICQNIAMYEFPTEPHFFRGRSRRGAENVIGASRGSRGSSCCDSTYCAIDFMQQGFLLWRFLRDVHSSRGRFLCGAGRASGSTGRPPIERTRKIVPLSSKRLQLPGIYLLNEVIAIIQYGG